MKALAASYGWPLASAAVVLTGLWLACLIVLPQLFMAEQSLWRESKAAANAESQLSQLFTDRALLDFDLKAAKDPAAKTKLETEMAALDGRIAELKQQSSGPQREYGILNYTRLNGLHGWILLRTLFFSVIVSLLAFAACYPMAVYLARLPKGRKAVILLVAITVPYAINELLRIYGWLMIFDYQGVINSVLQLFGIVDFSKQSWIPFLEYPFATFMALVYAYVLFMLFPIYNTVTTLDPSFTEAAEDLGASGWQIHRDIIIPHAKPGIVMGFIMTFMLAASSFSVPQIMSRGLNGDWFSQTIYRQFFEAHNWNIGAAYSFILLAACSIFIFAMMKVFGVGIRDIAK